jgi:hypothetical protein
MIWNDIGKNDLYKYDVAYLVIYSILTLLSFSLISLDHVLTNVAIVMGIYLICGLIVTALHCLGIFIKAKNQRLQNNEEKRKMVYNLLALSSLIFFRIEKFLFFHFIYLLIC